MDTRYWLLIESGARRGETIPIPASGLRVGRREDNDLVLADASVSGQHAAIKLDAAGALLSDLGSRNGTLVSGRKISETPLEHRAKLRFGTVEATFMDGEAEAPVLEDLEPAAAPGSAGAAAPAGDGVHGASSGRLEQSAKRSPVWALVALAVVAAGGALAWWSVGRGGTAGGGAGRVEAPPGNLLAGRYSFESGQGGPGGAGGDEAGPEADPLAHWNSNDAAPAGFGPGSAASSGSAGVEALLAEGEWAELISDPVNLRAPGLVAQAMLRGPGDARLGLELSSSSGQEPVLTYWTPPVDQPGFSAVTLAAPPLPGYDRARVILRGSGPGDVSCDDVSASAGPGPAPAATAAGAELYLLGNSGTTGAPSAPGALAALVRLGSSAIKGLACVDAQGRALPLESASSDRTLSISWPEGAARLALVVDRDVARATLATVGAGPAGSYRAEGAQFSAPSARAIVCGAGPTLMRLDFDPAVALSGAAGAQGYAIEAQLAGAGSLVLQLDFKGEQALGQELAARARDAERAGECGSALAAWGELLARAPYDAALVRQAGEARQRLEQAGLAELGALAVEAERAVFFAVPRMLDTARARALAFAASYSGAPLASDALAIADRLGERLAAREADARAGEDARLAAVRDSLAASEQPGLVALIERALAERALAERETEPREARPLDDSRPLDDLQIGER